MNNLRTLVFGFLLILSTQVFSQNKLEKLKYIPTIEMATKNTELLDQYLHLNETQKDQIQDLNEDLITKRKDIINNTSVFKLRSALKPLREDYSNRLDTILNTEQKTLYTSSTKTEIKEKMSVWIEEYK